jgi:hypothetical protein
VAAGILLLVGILVAVNAVYVTRVSSTLESMYNRLPVAPDPTTTPAAIRQMTDYLDRHETGLGLSIGFPFLDGIKERLVRLEAYAEAGDTVEYAATMAALEGCIKDLHRHERLHPRNVF